MHLWSQVRELFLHVSPVRSLHMKAPVSGMEQLACLPDSVSEMSVKKKKYEHPLSLFSLLTRVVILNQFPILKNYYVCWFIFVCVHVCALIYLCMCARVRTCMLRSEDSLWP